MYVGGKRFFRPHNLNAQPVAGCCVKRQRKRASLDVHRPVVSPDLDIRLANHVTLHRWLTQA